MRIRIKDVSVPVTDSTATIRVALDEVLLMCWPPAPLERANVHCKALFGTTRPSPVRRSSSGFILERVTGIGPAYSAWEADVLPLNYTRAIAIERSNASLQPKFHPGLGFTMVSSL